MTKIWYISYSIYDVTKNSKPYLWPVDHYIKILLKCLWNEIFAPFFIPEN